MGSHAPNATGKNIRQSTVEPEHHHQADQAAQMTMSVRMKNITTAPQTYKGRLLLPQRYRTHSCKVYTLFHNQVDHDKDFR